MADKNKAERELKAIFTEKWREQKEKEEKWKKRLKKVADEAVFCIMKEMKKTANSLAETEKRTDQITLKVANAFFISDRNRNLYSRFCYTVKNPETERFFFSDSLVLKTQEEESLFVQTVMSKLPDSTKCTVDCEKDKSFFAGNHYSFEITLNFSK